MSTTEKVIKSAAAVLCAVLLAALAAVGYYRIVTPDRFWVRGGQTLEIPSRFSITAKPAQPAAVQADAARQSAAGHSTLMLFGIIPIKEVETRTAQAAMLVPGGQPFGIKLITDGVMVIRTEEIDGVSPAEACGITVGDVIVSVNGERITSGENLSAVIRDSMGKTMEVDLNRGGEAVEVKLTPALRMGAYRAGIWVRDSTAGVGTVTFYDPASGIFGGLGHPVCDADTGELIPIRSGAVSDVDIVSFSKSANGAPGELVGNFTSPRSVGSILRNTNCGVFGFLNRTPSESQPVEMALRQEIQTGDATMLTTIDGHTPHAYAIRIESINLSGSDSKNMVIRVTDKALLAQTGGILQGMSGSPILQNGRLIGAVTHVFVKDPTMGYAVFADAMYDQTQELALEQAG
ncbi:MAG: SpoIVB peptidase [Oscillospiraceae bacterium]